MQFLSKIPKENLLFFQQILFLIYLYYHKMAKKSRLPICQGQYYNRKTVTQIQYRWGNNKMEKEWLQKITNQTQLEKIKETNRYTERFGLVLSEEDANLLVKDRMDSLKQQQRVEFGEGILPKIIYTFCDSEYLNQDNYVDTLGQLQEIFFLYKNEMHDEISDDELLSFMKEQFETVCFGDVDYLEGTCLAIFAEAIRAGYRGYQKTGGKGSYTEMKIIMTR